MLLWLAGILATAGPGDGEARNHERPPGATPGDVSHAVLRTALALPAAALDAALQPVRWTLMGVERIHLPERLRRWFCEGALCAYPTALVETGFGPSVGARLTHRDLFGGGERLRVRAGYGADSGRTLRAALRAERGPLAGRADAGYDVGPGRYFYGIGMDADRESRYLERRADAGVGGAMAFGAWTLGASLAIARADFDRPIADGPAAPDLHPDALVGFDAGTRRVAPALALALDTRRRGPGGWQAAVTSGPSLAFAADRGRHWRHDATLGAHLDLYRGTRVLSLVASAAAVTPVTGGVPFSELPALGGPRGLRGYRSGRFRDHGAVVLTAQYRWRVHAPLHAYLFADAGRTFAAPEALTWRGLRAAGGGGLGVLAGQALGAAVQVAVGDEGVEALIVLDPALE